MVPSLTPSRLDEAVLYWVGTRPAHGGVFSGTPGHQQQWPPAASPDMPASLGDKPTPPCSFRGRHHNLTVAGPHGLHLVSSSQARSLTPASF